MEAAEMMLRNSKEKIDDNKQKRAGFEETSYFSRYSVNYLECRLENTEKRICNGAKIYKTKKGEGYGEKTVL